MNISQVKLTSCSGESTHWGYWWLTETKWQMFD